MVEYKAIVVDLNRCVGCHACEVACRKENKLPEDEAWIKVDEIGPEQVDDNLAMDFVVSIAEDCRLCKRRLEEGLRPFCVSTCPTQALIYCNATDELLGSIRKGRVHVVKIVQGKNFKSARNRYSKLAREKKFLT
jgi:Fe-S-cluster-containing dehydrogenase component